MNNPLTYVLLAIILVLVIVILILTALIVSITRSNRKLVLEYRAENKDLLNRVLAKNTSDYKELTHVNDKKEPKLKRTLEDQLIEEGALMEGYPNPYPREL